MSDSGHPIAEALHASLGVFLLKCKEARLASVASDAFHVGLAVAGAVTGTVSGACQAARAGATGRVALVAGSALATSGAGEARLADAVARLEPLTAVSVVVTLPSRTLKTIKNIQIYRP